MLRYSESVEQEYGRKVKRNFKISLLGAFLGIAISGYGTYERVGDIEKSKPKVVIEY